MKRISWSIFLGLRGCALSPHNDRAYVSFLGDNKSGPGGVVLEFDRLHDLDNIVVYDSNKNMKDVFTPEIGCTFQKLLLVRSGLHKSPSSS
jgi:hypothetical protein